jgi:hypothetical protein
MAEEWMMAETLGVEQVINGDFDADTDWDALGYVSIVGGKAVFEAGAFGAVLVPQTLLPAIAGHTYKITAKVENWTAVSGYLSINYGGHVVTLDEAGDVDVIVVATSADSLSIGAEAEGGGFTLDDLSIREVLYDYYNVYRGQDGRINYTEPVGVMALNDTQVTIAAQDLPPGTTWHYVRRLVSADCGRESPDSPVCIVRIGADGSVQGDKPNPPDDLTAAAILGGRVLLRWRYSTAGQQAAPAGFVIFKDTLEVAYAAVPAGGGLKGDYGWTSGVLTHGAICHFCVRAYTAGGELSDNTAFVTVQADSHGPPAITGLTAEQEEI